MRLWLLRHHGLTPLPRHMCLSAQQSTRSLSTQHPHSDLWASNPIPCACNHNQSPNHHLFATRSQALILMQHNAISSMILGSLQFAVNMLASHACTLHASCMCTHLQDPCVDPAPPPPPPTQIDGRTHLQQPCVEHTCQLACCAPELPWTTLDGASPVIVILKQTPGQPMTHISSSSSSRSSKQCGVRSALVRQAAVASCRPQSSNIHWGKP